MSIAEGSSSTMPPSRLSLTIIVAASPNMGIGLGGKLPWRLKSEMQYFARVTTRVPQQHQHAASADARLESNHAPLVQNAVIMGRKTWESIPAKFRPLKDRLNVVLSSSAGEPCRRDGALWVDGLDRAVAILEELRSSASSSSGETAAKTERSNADIAFSGLPSIARAFVIGGSAVYKAALDLPQTQSMLLTRVDGEWECDTFFPVEPESDQNWERKSLAELNQWTGESIAEGKVQEPKAQYELTLYQKGISSGN
jgi:dihydrofolate reductase